MIRPERLAAPAGDGAVLAVPDLSQVGDLLRSNRSRLQQFPGDVLGQSASNLRAQARALVLAAAADYHRAAGEPVPHIESDSLVVAGHQPELFHPGVWIKNFALAHLARLHQLTPLHLIVDNDTARSNVLRVPTANADRSGVRLEAIAFDHWPGDIPYEERAVVDEGLFAGLPERVGRVMRVWNYVPLLPKFWMEVVVQARRTRLLGERFARTRRTIERQWGCHNLEIPVSRICQTEAFAWFACHLLVELPRFHTIYNETVRDYRRRHKIRSRHHPVPDLATQGEWLELPLWAWRSGQPRRGRPFVRFHGGQVEMRVGDDTWPTLPTRASPATLVAAWQALEQGGFKLRSRALTNTLYARVFLADLFVHGIGGAKYDELTDVLMRRFYGMEATEYLVLSGTLRLPIAGQASVAEEFGRVQHLLRDLQFNPQRHLGTAEQANREAVELVGEKQAWIERPVATPTQRRERFEKLRRVNDSLHAIVSNKAEEVMQLYLIREQDRQADAILRRRDYASCLYDEKQLRECFQQLPTAATAINNTVTI